MTKAVMRLAAFCLLPWITSQANAYISDAEDEKVKLAMGETENTHDLTIALQKASAAISYTVAIRDKFLESYRTIMNIQI